MSKRRRSAKSEVRATAFGCTLVVLTLLLVVAACNAVFSGGEPEPTPTPAREAQPSPTPQESASDPAEDDGDPDPNPNPEPDNDSVSVYYDTCADARRDGAAPLYAGDPGYRPELDRDKDGDACE